jgi:LmbE family N-acetylglucosaminyl deacetylase/SAM-dependent methyltransferase
VSAFTHLDSGTHERLWRADPTLDQLARLAPPTSDTALTVLSAHPDDESLGAGGLLSAAARAGCAIRVIVASDGTASHPHSSTHTPERLAQLRRQEMHAAVQALAPRAELVFLGLPDGRLAEFGEQLDQALAASAPGWLATPWRGDRHPDHTACADAARRFTRAHPGATLLEFPIWAWHWAGSDDDDSRLWSPGGPPVSESVRLDLSNADIEAKTTAIACHLSQTADLSSSPGDEAILPADILAHFSRPFEVFIRTQDAPASDPAYFDRLYAMEPDPWGLATRFYEQRKREILLASLPQSRFRRAFEPGCALGALTERLAQRCDEVMASDASPPAVAQAQVLVTAPNARIARGQIPGDWPNGEFDLIVISEVGYYCLDLDFLHRRIEESLAPDGTLVACHWRHAAPDHPRTADAVHLALGLGLRLLVAHHEEDFRLDVWNRTGLSPAAAEHIV